ncbi:butyrophilin-like protein 2 [Salarias fasciatus]|uniref:butyrophilin-like protein 2 n=1 Tax=Salarias fasciatus TaxID=181472 RepID=UPI001176BDC1|nr:butyrophilin-like protein 2 [Salarias fasciatus]
MAMKKKMAMKIAMSCLLLILPCGLALPDHQVIRAQIGQTVILPCSYQSHTPVLVLQWNQTNIQAEHENDYVLLNREGSLVTDHQLQRFRGRVELQDPKLENGNFNLTLKNVADSDDGTYECKVFQKTEFISLTIVSLIIENKTTEEQATESKSEDGQDKENKTSNELTIGLSVVGILLLFLFLVFVFRKRFSFAALAKCKEICNKKPFDVY